MVWFGKVAGPLGGAALQEEAFYLRQALRTLPVLFLLSECGCHVISQLPTPDRLYQSGTGSQNKTLLHCVVVINRNKKVFQTVGNRTILY